MENYFEGFQEALQRFKNPEQAKAVLKLGRNKRANVIARIPGSSYYRKVCIAPKCQRSFEGTIRGQYCNYAPSGTGSSCRVAVMRLKQQARAYLFAQSLLLVVLIYVVSLFAKQVSQQFDLKKM